MLVWEWPETKDCMRERTQLGGIVVQKGGTLREREGDECCSQPTNLLGMLVGEQSGHGGGQGGRGWKIKAHIQFAKPTTMQDQSICNSSTPMPQQANMPQPANQEGRRTGRLRNDTRPEINARIDWVSHNTGNNPHLGVKQCTQQRTTSNFVEPKTIHTVYRLCCICSTQCSHSRHAQTRGHTPTQAHAGQQMP